MFWRNEFRIQQLQQTEINQAKLLLPHGIGIRFRFITDCLLAASEFIQQTEFKFISVNELK